jgi:hypothetical protein
MEPRRMSEANELTKELLVQIPEQFPQIRCWRNNRVKARVKGAGGRIRFMDAGVDGQADISGIMGPYGRRLEIEVKAGDDRLSQDQKDFRDMILRHGGIYIEARGVEGALQHLRELICRA